MTQLAESLVELKEKYLEYYSELPIQRLAAASIGRNEDTIITWRKDDPEFAEQVEAARSAWALEKVKGVRDKTWLLERIIREHFTQKSEVDVTSGGKPIMGGTAKVNDVSTDNSVQEAPTVT